MAKRDYYFDNAKFILIFFVVFGHLLQSYIGADTFIFILYKIIYTFHMPAFILVSGFFAKGFYERGYISKIAKKLILPYIIFQIIYSVFYYFLFSESMLEIDMLNPHWSLWFLVSLFCWNILLILFNKLKPQHAIILSILIGLAVGYMDFISNYLSLSRTFVFFPFFLIGYYMKKEHFQLITTKKAKIISGMIILMVITILFFFPEMNEKWFFASKPYSEFTSIATIGLIKRVGIYMMNFIMIIGFFAFVPKNKLFFTRLGKNTLYVYLLHGFIVRTFRESNIEEYLKDSQPILLVLLFTILLTIFLSSKFVKNTTQPLIEMNWVSKKHLFNQYRQ